jgi:hypothetical protein
MAYTPAFERRNRAGQKPGEAKGDAVVKLDHALVKYLAPALEPGFDRMPPGVLDWRSLTTPRLRRMWNDIPLEVRCALVESYQKLLSEVSA